MRDEHLVDVGVVAVDVDDRWSRLPGVVAADEHARERRVVFERDLDALDRRVPQRRGSCKRLAFAGKRFAQSFVDRRAEERKAGGAVVGSRTQVCLAGADRVTCCRAHVAGVDQRPRLGRPLAVPCVDAAVGDPVDRPRALAEVGASVGRRDQRPAGERLPQRILAQPRHRVTPAVPPRTDRTPRALASRQAASGPSRRVDPLELGAAGVALHNLRAARSTA